MSSYTFLKNPVYWLELAIGIGGVTLAAMQERSKTGSFGRRYASSEWLAFFSEPGEPDAAMRSLASKFTIAVRTAYDAFLQNNRDMDPGVYVDDDSLAYRTYASIVGHGIGLWDGDLFFEHGIARTRAEKIGKALDVFMKNQATVSRLGNELDEAISIAREEGES